MSILRTILGRLAARRAYRAQGLRALTGREQYGQERDQ